MKRFIAVPLLLCAAASTALAADDASQARIARSKAAIQTFAGKLKAELGRALKEGGPVHAIDVCNRVAPAVADEVSMKMGLHIGRTSLKSRNPADVPDAWERKVLEQFEQRRAKGEDPARMAVAAVVEVDGKKEFRFMKAIAMPPLSKAPCLRCHGENIDPKIAAKLRKLYPHDQATGYKAGDIRGAFIVRQPM